MLRPENSEKVAITSLIGVFWKKTVIGGSDRWGAGAGAIDERSDGSVETVGGAAAFVAAEAAARVARPLPSPPEASAPRAFQGANEPSELGKVIRTTPPAFSIE